MSFIENFRTYTQNKIPNNAPLKPQTPVFEQPKTSPETKQFWADEDARINKIEFQNLWEKEEMAGQAADRGTLTDIADVEPSTNLLFKDNDVIKNKDNLIKVVDSLYDAPTWDTMLNTVRRAYKTLPKSNGVTNVFSLLDEELTEMKRQAEEGATIYPRYFLDWLRNRLKYSGDTEKLI